MRVAVLVFLILLSALGVVYTKYRSRLLFGEIQQLQTRIEQAETESSNLQIEYTMLAGRNELERQARKKLGMRYPDPASIVYISLQDGLQREVIAHE